MYLLIVEDKKYWPWPQLATHVMSSQEYLEKAGHISRKTKIINLCNHFKQLSIGYYCSLLAEARGCRVLPTIHSVLQLDKRAYYADLLMTINSKIQNELVLFPADQDIEIFSCFGQTLEAGMEKLTRFIFKEFNCPLTKIILRYKENAWHIQSIQTYALKNLPEHYHDFFISVICKFIRGAWVNIPIKSHVSYDLAILADPNISGASDKKALKKFVRIGQTLGLNVELIGKKDYNRLLEFDALFIRDTTAINNHTFRFAQKAQNNDLVVIDSPRSIFYCANKVYLAELFKINNIGTLKTIIFNSKNMHTVLQEFTFPFVLKTPDGCFSQGVYKIESAAQFEELAKKLLEDSVVILAQEYLYTPFDWRIGILNGKILYANQYFMAQYYWKIVRYTEAKKSIHGGDKAVPPQDVPKKVADMALRATALIGDGLYGVDLKQDGDKVYVIEINDNPNIDAGVEDNYLKDDLYRQILKEFLRRLNKQRRIKTWSDKGL